MAPTTSRHVYTERARVTSSPPRPPLARRPSPPAMAALDVKAWAVASAGAPIAPMTITLAPLKDDEV